MDLHVDLGQVIIAALIGGVGYLLKMQIGNFAKQVDKHEEIIVSLVGDVQRLIGINIGIGRQAHNDATDAAGELTTRRRKA